MEASTCLGVGNQSAEDWTWAIEGLVQEEGLKSKFVIDYKYKLISALLIFRVENVLENTVASFNYATRHVS